MFAQGIRPPVDGHVELDALVPLAEADDHSRGETGIAAAADMFVRTFSRLKGVEPDQLDVTLLGSSAGRAGARLVGLLPDTGNYRRLLQMIRAGKTLSAAQGRAYLYLATLWSHGETDQLRGTSGAAYASKLALLTEAISADARRISGQEWSPPLLAYQPASQLAYLARGKPETPFRPEIALAIRSAAHSNPDIFCVLPLYIGDFRDDIHATNLTYQEIGKYYGRALAKLVHARMGHAPVPPLALDLANASWSADGVRLRFAVPHGPLAFDTQWVAAVPNMGFDLWTPDEQLIPDAITGVTIVAPDEVLISFARPVPSGSRLTYAFGRPGDPARGGREYGPRGNLRDSEGDGDSYTDVSGTTRRLDNWALIFEVAKP
ncbi:hypothetical protein NVS89_19715 [Ancylobacter sp. MQZ15Z-1]|uniref:Sialate O-acetylesterase domain-containing protein n=1 Tax=Ancylobacter mangrovi TaxID=2972472 RepID=A0A9X2PG59_9HYPH|nr:hypothetical protein [Ancylobacter mangrovi]MCS0497320.1 hypothetical protein [Ancylobacter mangrovi]